MARFLHKGDSWIKVISRADKNNQKYTIFEEHHFFKLQKTRGTTPNILTPQVSTQIADIIAPIAICVIWQITWQICCPSGYGRG